MAVITIRDVPDEVKHDLVSSARGRGQSLQAYLLGVLERQARFARNRQIIADIERDLAEGGGAGPDAPDAAAVLEQSRRERDVTSGGSEPGGAA
jgi:hypothetical protein